MGVFLLGNFDILTIEAQTQTLKESRWVEKITIAYFCTLSGRRKCFLRPRRQWSAM